MGWVGAEVSSAPVGCSGAIPGGSPGHGALLPFPGLFSLSARGSVSELSSVWAPGGLQVEVHHVQFIPPQGERLCRHQGQKAFPTRSEQIPPPPLSLRAVSEGLEPPGKFPGCPHGNSSFQGSPSDLLGSDAGSINQL